MTFRIYLPEVEVSQQRGKPFPAIFFLAGLTANHENVSDKSGYARFARQHRLAVVFPDTSPRNTNIPNISDDW